MNIRNKAHAARKATLGLALGLLCSLTATTSQSAPAWSVNLQLEITEVIPLALTEDGLVADVRFAGDAGGPLVGTGTVAGVDHVLFGFSGDAYLDVYLTITDEAGDQLSANITGIATPVGPGKYLLQDASGTIIDGLDPYTGVLHATTGQYAALIGTNFEDLGFISGFSLFPAAGSVHAKWYLPE